MDGDIRKRIENSGVGLIKKAWEVRKTYSDQVLYFDDPNMPQIKFTGDNNVDGYLTRMSQIKSYAGLYDTYRKMYEAETYKDSLAYKYYTIDRKDLVGETLNLTISGGSIMEFDAEKLHALNIIYDPKFEDQIEAIPLWYLIAFQGIFLKDAF